MVFSPVLRLPEQLRVFDFSGKVPEEEIIAHQFGVGRYNERRPYSYSMPLFGRDWDSADSTGKVPRNIHMGIDLFAPEGSEVFSFADGELLHFAYNAAPGDYGYTLVARYLLPATSAGPELELYALYGHLSKRSLEDKKPGLRLRAGERIAWLGDRSENGGWVPHLHFQLSYARPERADLPGVVSQEDHAQALLTYPDPRLVLGPIY